MRLLAGTLATVFLLYASLSLISGTRSWHLVGVIWLGSVFLIFAARGKTGIAHYDQKLGK